MSSSTPSENRSERRYRLTRSSLFRAFCAHRTGPSLSLPAQMTAVAALVACTRPERPSQPAPPQLTFEPGLRLEQYAEILEQAPTDIAAAHFLAVARRGTLDQLDQEVLASKPRRAPLEGYLLPGTYQVGPGETTAEELVREMLRRFSQVMTPPVRARVQQTTGFTLHHVVTLASIVEREAQDAAVRPRVAAMLLERLQRGDCLCVAAPLQYALGKPGDWWPALPATPPRTLRESPYNTYTHHGLPPGPICNPGADTLRQVAGVS